jgi:hypothetical protein
MNAQSRVSGRVNTKGGGHWAARWRLAFSGPPDDRCCVSPSDLIYPVLPALPLQERGGKVIAFFHFDKSLLSLLRRNYYTDPLRHRLGEGLLSTHGC